MVLILAIMTVSAYVGYMVGGNRATDDYVNNAASASSNSVYTVYNPFTVEQWGRNGEYAGFFSAGCLGGLLVGYLFPVVFRCNVASTRRKD